MYKMKENQSNNVHRSCRSIKQRCKSLIRWTQKTAKEGKLVFLIYMIIMWLLHWPTCLQHKTRNPSSCASKRVTWMGKKQPRKFSWRTGSAARQLKTLTPLDSAYRAHSCLPKVCVIMHAAAEVTTVQSEAEGIDLVLFGMMPVP